MRSALGLTLMRLGGYFFVLDKDGKILYATSGKYLAKKMDEIEAVMEEE